MVGDAVQDSAIKQHFRHEAREAGELERLDLPFAEGQGLRQALFPDVLEGSTARHGVGLLVRVCEARGDVAHPGLFVEVFRAGDLRHPGDLVERVVEDRETLEVRIERVLVAGARRAEDVATLRALRRIVGNHFAARCHLCSRIIGTSEVRCANIRQSAISYKFQIL